MRREADHNGDDSVSIGGGDGCELVARRFVVVQRREIAEMQWLIDDVGDNGV